MKAIAVYWTRSFLANRKTKPANPRIKEPVIDDVQRDNPGCDRGADICSQNDPHGLSQGHQFCVDHTDDHHGRYGTRLDHGGYRRTRRTGFEPIVRDQGNHPAQTVAGDRLHPFRHVLHAQEKNTQSAEDVGEHGDAIHDGSVPRFSWKKDSSKEDTRRYLPLALSLRELQSLDHFLLAVRSVWTK